MEQLREKGKRVTLIEKEAQVLPQLDKHMVESLHRDLLLHGVEVRLNDGLARVEAINDRYSAQHGIILFPFSVLLHRYP